MQKKNKRPLYVSITGGIASGKSLFAELIEKKGYQVYYADKIGHEVLELDYVKQKIQAAFGDDLIEDNIVDRKQLAEIVFSSLEKLRYLNNLTHKEILSRMNSIMENSEEKVIFFEIPLLFEAKLQKSFDFNILIIADEKTRISRITKRDKISKRQAKGIIKYQMDDKIKKNLADLIITNSSSKESFENQTAIFFQMIKFIKKRKLAQLNK